MTRYHILMPIDIFQTLLERLSSFRESGRSLFQPSATIDFKNKIFFVSLDPLDRKPFVPEIALAGDRNGNFKWNIAVAFTVTRAELA